MHIESESSPYMKTRYDLVIKSNIVSRIYKGYIFSPVDPWVPVDTVELQWVPCNPTPCVIAWAVLPVQQ